MAWSLKDIFGRKREDEMSPVRDRLQELQKAMEEMSGGSKMSPVRDRSIADGLAERVGKVVELKEEKRVVEEPIERIVEEKPVGRMMAERLDEGDAEKKEVEREWDAPEGTMVNGWKVYKLRQTRKGVVKVIKMEEVKDVVWPMGQVDRLVDWDPMDLSGFAGGKIADADRVEWIERIAKVRPWVTRKKMAETMGVSLVTIKREMQVLEEQREMAYWGNSKFGHWVVGKEEVAKYPPEEFKKYKG